MVIGNGILSAYCSEKIVKNCGSITLSTKWAINVLKLLDWVWQSRSTAEKDMNPVLFVELAFSWKRNVAKIVIEHYIHKKMLLSFENTPVGWLFKIKPPGPITKVNRYQLSIQSVYLGNFYLFKNDQLSDVTQE